MTRLRVDGYEAESSIPFAAIDRLLIPLRRFITDLPASHQQALHVAVGATTGPPPDRFLVGLGVLGLLAAAADSEPVVCAVDDTHLLDRESLDVLSFVARRLEAESVALVLAGRIGHELEAATAGMPVLELVGLPADAGVKLLTSSVTAKIDPASAAQIVAATGGNPLALIDLAGELTARQLVESSFTTEPLPIGRHLEAHYLRRVRDLSAAAQLWLVVAAADSGGTLALVDAAARQLGLDDGLGDDAEGAGLVELSEVVRFRHPLVRSAAYNAAHGAQRRRVHTALAIASGQAGLVEVEAWHAARASLGPDPDVADRLEQVADLAARKGGSSSRARVLRQASALTPPGPLRYARLVAAAEAALAAGAAQLADTLLDDVDEGELDAVWLGRMIATRASIAVFAADPELTRAGAKMLRAAELFHDRDPALEQDAPDQGLRVHSAPRARRPGNDASRARATDECGCRAGGWGGGDHPAGAERPHPGPLRRGSARDAHGGERLLRPRAGRPAPLRRHQRGPHDGPVGRQRPHRVPASHRRCSQGGRGAAAARRCAVDHLVVRGQRGQPSAGGERHEPGP